MSVTYTYAENEAQSTKDFDTIAEAIEASSADVRAKIADPAYPIDPVSVDDHEGNFYDAETLIGMATPGPRR